MPSGATHDRITLTSLPIVGGVTLWLSQSASITLSLAGGFLFSGLMFGPDLDIYSVQYKRWGILRWMWRPYQKGMRHRSWLSHGFLIGTVVRLAYLSVWVLLIGAVGLAIAHRWLISSWGEIQSLVMGLIHQYPTQGLALLAGLELGAMSHVVSDSVESSWKKWHRRLRPSVSKRQRQPR